MSLVAIKDTARAPAYAGFVLKQRPKVGKSVAVNLKRLMAHRRWSQVKLAHESGVSQTHISALLRGDSSCTVDTANALAEPFGLSGWHLQIPELPDDLVISPAIERLVQAYLHASSDGRNFLDAAADRELKR